MFVVPSQYHAQVQGMPANSSSHLVSCLLLPPPTIQATGQITHCTALAEFEYRKQLKREAQR